MAELLVVDPRHPTPLYAQLEQGIRAAVATGRLKPGAQLPTVRQLAADLRVNANTVARVYVDLERAGVLTTRRGIGTFISAETAPASAKRGRRDPELRALARRCVDEAAVRGFTIDDLMHQLTELAGKSGG